jgi:hypothetical protein
MRASWIIISTLISGMLSMSCTLRLSWASLSERTMLTAAGAEPFIKVYRFGSRAGGVFRGLGGVAGIDLVHGHLREQLALGDLLHPLGDGSDGGGGMESGEAL